MTAGDKIRAALHHVPAHDRGLWLRIGMAIKSELGEEGFDLWDEWSQQDKSYNPKDARDVWRSIKANGKITVGTLFHEAKQRGWRDDTPRRGDPAGALKEAGFIASQECNVIGHTPPINTATRWCCSWGNADMHA